MNFFAKKPSTATNNPTTTTYNNTKSKNLIERINVNDATSISGLFETSLFSSDKRIADPNYIYSSDKHLYRPLEYLIQQCIQYDKPARNYCGDVEILLKNGADPNAQFLNNRRYYITNNQQPSPIETIIMRLFFPTGETALTYAARKIEYFSEKHQKVVNNLLSHNAKVNGRNKLGQTPLMCAKNVELATFLLENGADINAIVEPGVVETDEAESLVKQLIESKNGYLEVIPTAAVSVEADNETINAGMTALMHATSPKMATFLLENGADVNMQDSVGMTALMHVVSSPARFLNDAADKFRKTRTDDYETSMHNDLNALTTSLLDNVANVNTQDNAGMTALMHATSPGVVELLLNKGADVNMKDKAGMTALIHFIKKPVCDGGQWRRCTLYPNRILFEENQKIMIEKLLASVSVKQNIDTPDKNKKSALMHAVLSRNIDVAKLLIDCGANVSQQDANDNTPLMVSFKPMEAYWTEDSIPVLKISENKLSTLLLNQVSDDKVNLEDTYGDTALMLACKNGDIISARSLLSKGATVNNKEGRTALDYVVFYCEDKDLRDMLSFELLQRDDVKISINFISFVITNLGPSTKHSQTGYNIDFIHLSGGNLYEFCKTVLEYWNTKPNTNDNHVATITGKLLEKSVSVPEKVIKNVVGQLFPQQTTATNAVVGDSNANVDDEFDFGGGPSTNGGKRKTHRKKKTQSTYRRKKYTRVCVRKRKRVIRA